MGSLHRETWVSSGSGTSRRQRASGVYWWYMPDRLSDLHVTLEQDVVADVARAEAALATVRATVPVGYEGIARLLLRSEAISSSHIEGLTIGSKRLVQAELQRREPESVRYDAHAAEILGNLRAVERGVTFAVTTKQLTVDALREMHALLFAGTRHEEWGGVIRTSQNWVGGSSYNPLSAEYVPPAPHMVPSLLEDLVCFANRENVSPVVQAALCHAQFESIHPFADGNGRAGRALIQVCLMRRGAIGPVMPPVSLALATSRRDYFSCLHAMQSHTNETAAHEAINDWVSFFSGAIVEACEDMARIESELLDMRRDWEARLGRVRAGSAAQLLLERIQGMPIFTVETMVRETGLTKQAVSPAVSRLAESGIVRQTSKGKRDRVYETPEVLELFRVVERRLASPARNTSIELPVRPVPYRA